MLPGKYKDMEAITLTDMRELIGRTQTGRLTEDELMKIEEAAPARRWHLLHAGHSQYHELSGRGPGA